MPDPIEPDYLCSPKLISATTDRKYWTQIFGSQLTRSHRDIETRVYRCPWKDTADAPSAPLNPDALSPVGGLTDEWQCTHFGFEGKYDIPMSRVYEEVWEKKGEWVQEGE